MAVYVCATLSLPDANGFQNCTAWTEYVSWTDTLAITTQQANDLASSAFSFLAVFFIYRALVRLL